MTDYIIATSLQAAYNAQAAALSNPAPMTPDVKQLVADEVKRQLALENQEAQNAAKNADPDPASSSVQRLLTDGTAHVFIAGADLDVVDSAGSECAVSEGDALQLSGQTAPDATAVNLVILASKGGRECPKGDLVSVGLQDLQDMQNHMRETIGTGMQELQAKQGKGGLPAAPAAARAAPVETAYASSAPPPDQNVAQEITQEAQEADQAEKEAGETPAPIAPPPAEITLGQTVAQVEAALGQPKSKFDAGHQEDLCLQRHEDHLQGRQSRRRAVERRWTLPRPEHLPESTEIRRQRAQHQSQRDQRHGIHVSLKIRDHDIQHK